jgi:hypothetical protein
MRDLGQHEQARHAGEHGDAQRPIHPLIVATKHRRRREAPLVCKKPRDLLLAWLTAAGCLPNFVQIGGHEIGAEEQV